MRAHLYSDMLAKERGCHDESREQRKNDRIAYTAGAVIESLDAIASNSAWIANYSSEGLYFESNTLITPGTNIYLGIFGSPYADASAAYECHRVKIKWCKDLYNSDYKYGYGAQHLDPIGAYSRDEEQQFYEIPQYLKLMLADRRESRNCPRKQAARQVILKSSNHRTEGVVRNASKHGLFIETHGHLEIGDRIHLAFPGSQFDKGLMLHAQVVRKTSSGIGVKLLGIIRRPQARSRLADHSHQ